MDETRSFPDSTDCHDTHASARLEAGPVRETFLTYLQCPECRGDLEVHEASVCGDRTDSEDLKCRSCGRRYPVEEEVPNLLLDGKQGDEKRMRSGFEFEWKHFFRREKPYLTQIALEWVRPLCPEDFAGRVVLDAGCGMGRNTRVFSSLGPKVIIGFDLHDGVKLAARLCRDQPNALFAKADLFRPPLRPVFDVIVSIGVLHHTPDPGAAFHSLAMLLKPGGRIAVFIYSQQRERLIMRTVTVLRLAVFSRLPLSLLLAFSYALGCLLYPVVFWLYPMIETGRARGTTWLPFSEYFGWVRKTDFENLVHVLFDHLVTPIASYHSEEDIHHWVDSSGLELESLWNRYGMSWVVVARRPASDEAVTGG